MFYKVTDFANKIGVSPSTLRNWETEGILKPHHRTPTGYRIYSEEQLLLVLAGNIEMANKVSKEN